MHRPREGHPRAGLPGKRGGWMEPEREEGCLHIKSISETYPLGSPGCTGYVVKVCVVCTMIIGSLPKFPSTSLWLILIVTFAL